MKLRQAERKRAKIKMALQGSAGSGKTYSSLLLAGGLTNGNYQKIALIDTENGSSDLYAHLGSYNVLQLDSPFTPEKYIEAIAVCEKAGMDVIIIDSISHCWDYLLDYHSNLAGNSFTNWAKVTPRQKAFVDKILQSNTHIIATMRTKQDYVLNQKDGKYVPEKVGLKAIQRDGVEYEFTLVFDIDSNHFATASKDRTEIFNTKQDFIINKSTGKKILDWCLQEDNDKANEQLETALEQIKNTNTVEGLRKLYAAYPGNKETLLDAIMIQKSNIENNVAVVVPNSEVITQQFKSNENGTANS